MKLNELGERKIIEKLAALSGQAQFLTTGIGDDCAVVNMGEMDLMLTSDPIIEGVHFEMGTDPRRIGNKAVGRVLSDLAAMGAEPLWVLLNIVAPGDLDMSFLETFYEGATALLSSCNAAIIGGDVAEGPTFQCHAFAVGQRTHNTAALRSHALPDDNVYVTGYLGGSLRGKHLDFTPRTKEAHWLCRGQWVGAMIDISDGLVSELTHLAQASNVQIHIDETCIPIDHSAHKMSDKQTALSHAMHDGEDFELLFTVPQARTTTFDAAWENMFDLPCTRIGHVVPGSGIVTNRFGQPISGDQRGFEHFQ